MDTQKTIPQMISSRIKKYGGKLLFQHKDGWSWKQITWLDFEKSTKDIASFLMSLGFASGSTALMVSGNRTESLYVEFAIYLLGGISIPIAENEAQDVIVRAARDSRSRFIFVGGKSTLNKLRNIKDEIPSLAKIVSFSDTNIVEDEKVIPFKRLLKFGSIKRKGLEDELVKTARSILPDSPSTIFYSFNSDRKIDRKEVTHRDLVEAIRVASEKLSLINEEDQAFSYLPSVSSFERFVNYLGIYMGIRIAIVETREDFFEDILEVKPTVLFETKSGLENIYSKILLKKGSPNQKLRSTLGGRIKYVLVDSMPRGEIKNLFSKSDISLIEMPELASL
ncbi:MAG: AMP-binding protein [Ignavibacteriales bacterium]